MIHFLLTIKKISLKRLKVNDFVSYFIDRLYYSCHKITINCSGSYIDSPKWLKSEKATINPRNEGSKCFQYAVTVGLNHKEIPNHLERISNIEKYTDSYNWKNIKFLSGQKDWERFEKDKPAVVLNILYVDKKIKKNQKK